MGLRKAGRMVFSIKREVSLPPLPCPSRISVVSFNGSGQSANGTALPLSDDIVLSQGDVNQVPQHVQQRRVYFLDAMDRPRFDGEAVVADIRHAPAVAAGEADGQY